MKLICLTCFHSFDEPDLLRCPKCKSNEIQEMPTICILPENTIVFDNNLLEYWKKRCELAEKVINEIPGISENTYLEYQDFIISSEAKKTFFAGGLAEHPIIKSRFHKANEALKVNCKTWKEFIAEALKFACESGRITGDHDFNVDVAGTKDSFEQIAFDYLNSKKDELCQD